MRLDFKALATIFDGVKLIDLERHKQVYIKRFTSEHDEHHTSGQLVRYSICLLMAYMVRNTANQFLPLSSYDYIMRALWPWARPMQLHKVVDITSDPLELLAKAGALIVAEIERERAFRQKKDSMLIGYSALTPSRPDGIK